MKKIFAHFALLSGAVLFVGAAASSARADIIYLGPRVVQPSGQGVVPTVLTLQDNTKDSVERGAIIRRNGQDFQIEGYVYPGGLPRA